MDQALRQQGGVNFGSQIVLISAWSLADLYVQGDVMNKLIVAILLILSGCASSPIFGERFNAAMSPGMTASEVKNLLGNPDGYEKKGNQELYRYTDKLVSGWAHDKGNYEVLLEDGKVIQYGIGSMRFREYVPPNRTDVYFH